MNYSNYDRFKKIAEAILADKKAVTFSASDAEDPKASIAPVMGYGVSSTGSYITKAEASDEDWEGEWARVQRMRKEGHPLVFGGQCQAARGLINGRGHRITYE
jgi:hypothetical protein